MEDDYLFSIRLKLEDCHMDIRFTDVVAGLMTFYDYSIERAIFTINSALGPDHPLHPLRRLTEP